MSWNPFEKPFLSRRMAAETRRTKSTAVAMVYDVTPAERYCRVLLQNSTQLLVVGFPTNQQSQPGFVKPGNSVLIQFVGDNRSRPIVIGDGPTLPTVSMAIPATTPDDAILTGMQVTVDWLEDGDPEWSLTVAPGTYRLDGVIYSFDGLYMTADSTVYMEEYSTVYMGASSGTITLDAPPAVGSYRYDVISVDAYGTLVVTEGTESTGEPARPATPDNTVKLRHFFMYGGAEHLSPAMVGGDYALPALSFMSPNAASASCFSLGDSVAGTWSVYDQYGNLFKSPNTLIRWWLEGEGTLNGETEGATYTSYTLNGQLGFSYAPVGLTVPTAAIVRAQVDNDPAFAGSQAIFITEEVV